MAAPTFWAAKTTNETVVFLIELFVGEEVGLGATETDVEAPHRRPASSRPITSLVSSLSDLAALVRQILAYVKSRNSEAPTHSLLLDAMFSKYLWKQTRDFTYPEKGEGGQGPGFVFLILLFCCILFGYKNEKRRKREVLKV